MIRAALLALALAGPAAAEAPLRATVTPDPALAADPGFQAFLAEEAQAAVDLWTDLARDAGGDGWLTIADRVTFLSPRYASVLRRTEAGVGSVRDTVALEGLTIDRTTGSLIRLDAFLGGPGGGAALTAIAAALARGIAETAHAGAPGPDWTGPIRAATRPDLAVLQNFTLEAAPGAPARIGAIAFHFGAGEVAPDAVSVNVPAAILSAGLKPEVRPMFASDAP